MKKKVKPPIFQRLNLNMAELEEAELTVSRCFERQKRGKISLSERKKNRNI